MIFNLSEQSFYSIQILIGVSFIVAALYFQFIKAPKSKFKHRESDHQRDKIRSSHQKEKHDPLRLPGIRMDGPPHTILGIPRDANKTEIQEAYRKLMKRYHPDQVASPGSPQWNEAQKIAAAINRAKEEMIKGLNKA